MKVKKTLVIFKYHMSEVHFFCRYHCMSELVREINETVRLAEGKDTRGLGGAFNGAGELPGLVSSRAPMLDRHSRECLFRPIKQYPFMTEASPQGQGLHDLGTHYRLPDGLNAQTLEVYTGLLGAMHTSDRLSNSKTRALMEEKTGEILDAVIALNDELKPFAIHRGDMKRMNTVLGGVTSGYNADDIAFYIKAETEKNMGEIRRDPSYKNVREGIERETGHLGWFVSPKTMERIQKQLDERRPGSARPTP
jgi:hypothetical protein